MLRCLGPSCVTALSHLLNILNKQISLGTPAMVVIHSQVYSSLTLSHERYSRCTKSACDVICGIFVALFVLGVICFSWYENKSRLVHAEREGQKSEKYCQLDKPLVIIKAENIRN